MYKCAMQLNKAPSVTTQAPNPQWRQTPIWVFALGYFAIYAIYGGYVKAVSGGYLTDAPARLALLPGLTLGLLLILPAVIWRMRKRAAALGDGGRKSGLFSGPVLLSGVATAAIIGTTTFAYAFEGVSVLLALLLMRGGVLLLAPIVDRREARAISGQALAALCLSVLAVAVGVFGARDGALSLGAIANLGVYLAAYALRLTLMTRYAKTHAPGLRAQYFADEQVVSLGCLVLVTCALAFAPFSVGTDIRQGVALIFSASGPLLLLIGVFYGGVLTFGTLIYLDARENTFAIPVNRGASLLSGVAASAVLSLTFAEPWPTLGSYLGALLVLAALYVLSMSLRRAA